MKVLDVFYGEGCGQCHTMLEQLNSHKDELDELGVSVNPCDVEDNEDITIQLNIRTLPTIVLHNEDGNILKRWNGAQPINDILAGIKEA